MYCVRNVKDDIFYVGADDRKISKFENILDIHNGVSYNSYIIKDEKTCLLDTIDQSATKVFLENVEHVLDGRSLDYLVIHHMESDHCYNINEIVLRYPDVTLVGNATTFKYLDQFFPNLKGKGNRLVVTDGYELALGKHTLHFYLTPFVHWPEVMMSFDLTDKILFSADAFGTFSSLDGNLYNDDFDFEKDLLDEARLYYTNIVGKYGRQVQNAFKKLPVSEISMILPLHGPIWHNNLNVILDKYQHWSTYTYEDKEVIILYSSMYGNNENVANILANYLSTKGVKHIKVYDVSVTEEAKLVSESFRVSNIVLIGSTYNALLHPYMTNYINGITNMGLTNRTFTLIDNGTWGPMAKKIMKDMLVKTPSFTFTNTELSVLSSLKEEDLALLNTIADEVSSSLK